ncbi:hypothetical protein HAX54_047235 [Datura stramonium]|uniref:Uncharacterized protein n=1 Tax=Datura stramonium TaxID=4076 RepID=A0ABS8SS38_DATST|nr:hypothetical protein [Datura stramonium]
MATRNINWSNDGYSYVVYVMVRIAIEMVVLTLTSIPTPYYDSHVVCDVHKSNDVEDTEHDAQLIEMIKKIHEQQVELKEAMERMRSKFMEMQVEVENCNDLQVMVFANTQDESQIKEEKKFLQADSFEEAEIVSQSWLTEQAQLI